MVDDRYLITPVPEAQTAAEPLLLRFAGDIDFACADELEAAFVLFDRSGRCTVVVDLTDVGFIDAAGLSLIARLSVTATRRGGRVDILRAAPAVVRVLDVTGMTEAVRLVDPTVPLPAPRRHRVRRVDG